MGSDSRTLQQGGFNLELEWFLGYKSKACQSQTSSKQFMSTMDLSHFTIAMNGVNQAQTIPSHLPSWLALLALLDSVYPDLPSVPQCPTQGTPAPGGCAVDQPCTAPQETLDTTRHRVITTPHSIGDKTAEESQ